MRYLVFFNYECGTQVFGYYDYEEAKERYNEAVRESEDAGSKVELGLAEIQEVTSLNWPE